MDFTRKSLFIIHELPNHSLYTFFIGQPMEAFDLLKIQINTLLSLTCVCPSIQSRNTLEYSGLFSFRYANKLSLGDEVLGHGNDGMAPVKVKNISNIYMLGDYQFQAYSFIS